MKIEAKLIASIRLIPLWFGMAFCSAPQPTIPAEILTKLPPDVQSRIATATKDLTNTQDELNDKKNQIKKATQALQDAKKTFTDYKNKRLPMRLNR
jgi:peptidoglycan hydrolase CwlO-like protein